MSIQAWKKKQPPVVQDHKWIKNLLRATMIKCGAMILALAVQVKNTNIVMAK